MKYSKVTESEVWIHICLHFHRFPTKSPVPQAFYHEPHQSPWAGPKRFGWRPANPEAACEGQEQNSKNQQQNTKKTSFQVALGSHLAPVLLCSSYPTKIVEQTAPTLRDSVWGAPGGKLPKESKVQQVHQEFTEYSLLFFASSLTALRTVYGDFFTVLVHPEL